MYSGIANAYGNLKFSYNIATAPTVSTVYTYSDCGSIIPVATDALTLTIPAAIPGCWFEFINTGANTAAILDIKPASTDAFYGAVYSSATGTGLTTTTTLISSTTGSTLSNTKATANKGDKCIIKGIAANMWSILCNGIWTMK
jgi:hypothetical protein